MTAEGNDYFLGLYREANGTDGVRAATREQLKAGADFIKLMATGAYMNPGGIPGAAQLEVDEMHAAVEEAEKLGLHVAAHAHGAQGIKNAIRAGVRTIEHGTLIDDEGIELMREYGVYLVPTFVVAYQMRRHAEENIAEHMLEDERKDRDKRLVNLQRAIDAGVNVCYGTDAGTPFNFHGDNAYQLELFVKLNFFSPEMAIHTATGAAADAIGLSDRIGTLEPGKEADLVMVDDTLLKDLQGLSEGIEEVFHGGRRVRRECAR
jgi:imidazolonepropionase-like amidohydrolase